MVWIKDINKRKKYYLETSVKSPSEFVLKSLEYAKGKDAIDLGCGAGVDTKEIAKRGFMVTAVDINSDVKQYFSKKDLTNINLVIKPIENFVFCRYDFIYAKSSLVFLNSRNFYRVLKKIKESLNDSGVFAARLWGEKDSDYKKEKKGSKYTFVNIEKIKNFFPGYTFLEIEENEEDKYDANGRMKHWNFINIIIKKPNKLVKQT